MKLYQEMRLQALMLVSTGILLTVCLGFIVAGLIQSSMPYLLTAGGLVLIVAPIVMIGQRRSQAVIDRMAKIREGGGDAADLAWLKTRTK